MSVIGFHLGYPKGWVPRVEILVCPKQIGRDRFDVPARAHVGVIDFAAFLKKQM